MAYSGIEVKEATLEEVMKLADLIPEFEDPYTRNAYEKRLTGKNSLILIASYSTINAGFKVGYALDDTTFYSWFGGVLPTYRQKGIAKALATYQESWATNNGYSKVRVKTRNHLAPMLLFAINSGFQIIDVEKRTTTAQNRILLEKDL